MIQTPVRISISFCSDFKYVLPPECISCLLFSVIDLFVQKLYSSNYQEFKIIL